MGDSKESFLEKIRNALKPIRSVGYSCLITILIGNTAPVENSDGSPGYILTRESNRIAIIPMEEIHSLISTSLSGLTPAKPAIVFHTCISESISTSVVDRYICGNTFFCYASNDVSSLPKGVHPHQIVQSLYEILEKSPDEHLLLIELFCDVRDKYFKCFPNYVKDSFNKDTTLYSKYTIRYPVCIKLASKTKSKPSVSVDPLGLFFFVYNSAVLEGEWGIKRGLMENVESVFKSMNYIIGKEVLLTDKQNFTQSLAINNTSCEKCKFIFIIVLTKASSGHQVIFDDGASIDVDMFSVELTESLPPLPKVVFFSQLVDGVKLGPPFPVQQYEHMIVVYSIEKSLSDNSLIINFALEVKRNYYAELHALLRNCISHSTKSSYVQVIDGFKNNFYINYNCHLAQLLNSESSEFNKHFEKACREGAEPFKFYRLMIVGPEGVGKTSLLRALTGQSFQPDETSTEFLNKYDLLVQKLSHDWSQMEDFQTYIKNIEETRQDLAMKLAAQMFFQPQNLPISLLKESKTTETEQSTSVPTAPELVNNLEYTKPELISNPNSPEEFEFASTKKIAASLDRIRSLSCKSDFMTAWDFAGQNYLYCFHSIFLSSRSVYLIPIDLNIRDLTAEVGKRHREDRNDLRSKSGVPRTYLEVYEFWLNAIYSVSKTSISISHHASSKIIFVFTKADEVQKADNIARDLFETLKSYMSRKNKAFTLVHEEDGLFLLSCKTDSEYNKNITKLKSTIKRVSDEVAYEEPIPIKWLKLANEILKEELPILDRNRIQHLVNEANCSNEMKHFLHFFHEIGFFFYKEEKIIINIQSFLDLIHHILFPQCIIKELKKSENKLKLINKTTEEGKISLDLFEQILDYMNLRVLQNSLLDLLQQFGILIRCELREVISNMFYVPYLLTGTLNDLTKGLPPHSLRASFCIYFPDGFLPASLYFTLLSGCLRRNEKQSLSPSILGFDCAIFYVSEVLLATFDFFSDRSRILVLFYSINSLSCDEEDVISDIVDYLVFLQLFLADIQTRLIPCGNIAKLMFLCDYCDTFYQQDKEAKPMCSLDTVLSIDASEIKLLEEQFHNTPCVSTVSTLRNSMFCCQRQLSQICQYIKVVNPIRQHHQRSYNNTTLAEFILNNRHEFKKHLNWGLVSKKLYTFGLISVKRYSHIIDKEISIQDLAKELIMELFHKGPSWAVKLYFTLLTEINDRGHRKLVKLIENRIDSEYSKEEDHSGKNSISSGNLFIYNMYRTSHGIAFIVNIESFENSEMYKKREGSKHDIRSLVSLFYAIHYDTKVYENLTRKEFLKALKSIRASDHSEHDSFFCVIMSHGNDRGEIIFSNDKPLSKNKIVSEFSPRYCMSLESKPKIFLFQACRGKGKTVRRDLDEDVSQKELYPEHFVASTDNGDCAKNTTKRICPEPICLGWDTFIGDSTINQYVSYRDKTEGTFFIQSFCRVMQSCSTREFTCIMMEVRREVSLISKEFKQCTEDTNRLRGQVYF